MAIEYKEGTFKGKPIFEIWDTARKTKEGEAPRPTLSFGVWKAGLILDAHKAITEFVEAHEGE